MQVIKEKRHSAINNLEIENFIKDYKMENKREPSVEEIYDNLEDNVNRKYIDLFVGVVKCPYKKLISVLIKCATAK